MNKSELVEAVAARADLSKAAAANALDAVLDTITEVLAAEQSVTLAGFGTWETAKRSARQVRSLQTGAMIAVEETTVARFRPGKKLKDAVAKKELETA